MLQILLPALAKLMCVVCPSVGGATSVGCSVTAEWAIVLAVEL
jgi:hypothetical protein